jgi:hypothetical protein
VSGAYAVDPRHFNWVACHRRGNDLKETGVFLDIRLISGERLAFESEGKRFSIG